VGECLTSTYYWSRNPAGPRRGDSGQQPVVHADVSLATAVPEKEHGRASRLINTAQELGSASCLAALASLGTLGAASATFHSATTVPQEPSSLDLVFDPDEPRVDTRVRTY
jgi:hypothetical protein